MSSASASVESYPFLRPPAAPDEIGRLGEYRVLKALGRGAMGVVFHAEDPALQRPVALKVMNPKLDDEVKPWPRFLREARILASIKHENVVMIYQAGQEGGAVYLAMELLEGQTLADRIKAAAPLPPAEVLRVGREIASGLVAIHRRRLVHRDIKPANLWLQDSGEGRGGTVKILDFGLARVLNDNAHLTETGMVVGTPAFMSPEQARGEDVDARSDLFSLGCVLYAMSTGAEPFPGPNTMARLTALAVDEPRRVEELNEAVPLGVSDLIMGLLAKDPDDRPRSAEEVIDLIRVLEQSPPARKRPADSSTPTKKLSRAGRRSKRTKKAPRRRRNWGAIILVAGGLLAFTGAAALLARWALTPAAEAGPAAQERTWLSDERPAAAAPEWPLGAPPGTPVPNPFTVMSVDGKRSPHGVPMHATGLGATYVSYSLGKRYDTFSTEVSLNDSSPRSNAPLTFSVYGDGRLLWRSSPVQTRADTQTCQLSVKDVDLLKLEVTNSPQPPDGMLGAHGLWVEPSVTRRK